MFTRNQPLEQPKTGGSFIRERDGSLTPVQQTEPGLVRKPHPDMQQASNAPAANETSEE